MDKEYRLYHIAKLYYVDQMHQNEIADLLGLSKMMVSRLLKKAKDEGIVEMRVNAPKGINMELGAKLRNKYRMLKDVVVASVAASEDTRRVIGRTAADYVVNLLRDGDIMGISWGKTIYEFSQALRKSEANQLCVLQLSGSFLVSNDYLMMPQNLVHNAAERLGAQAMLQSAPLYANRPETCMALKQDPLMLHIQEIAEKCTMNIIGLSSLQRSTMQRVGVLSEEDRRELLSKGAIGDIMGVFIDKDGNEVEWSRCKCYTGISLDCISKAKYVICLAGEEEKAQMLHLAIKFGYVNIPIISERLAEALLAQ